MRHAGRRPCGTLSRVMGVNERFACRVTGQNQGAQGHPVQPETPADRDAGLRTWPATLCRLNRYGLNQEPV
jgi:hypothetical protein